MEGDLNDFDRPWVLGKKMEQARTRCLNVAESERLLGYTDTALMYREIAGEFKYLALWVAQQIWESYPPAA